MSTTIPAPEIDADEELPTPAPTAEDFAEQVFGAVLGAQAVQAAYLGDRLGWYRLLAEEGPLTSAELAERSGTAERYAREWLEHQAAWAWLTVDDPTRPVAERRFALPAAHAEVLTDPDSLNFAAPFAQFIGGLGLRLDDLATAYRTGTGISWDDLGPDPREAQAAANRPFFLHQLAGDLVPAVDDLSARLADGGRVADIGCGAGWSAIGLALAHPEIEVDGYDLDAPSVEMARRNAVAHGVADRVHFHCIDAADAEAEPYDLVLALECVHDMGDPVSVLATMRRFAGDDGIVVVMDERVGEHFAGPAGAVERLYYGFSITACLPDGLSHDHSVGTGTVMRSGTLRTYAADAGFAEVEVLPVDNELFRFYRLHSVADD